jgi:hypothetical protein
MLGGEIQANGSALFSMVKPEALALLLYSFSTFAAPAYARSSYPEQPVLSSPFLLLPDNPMDLALV